MLRTCVRSLAGVADYLTALDGPFAAFPDADRRPRSPKRQRDAITKAAMSIGIPHHAESGLNGKAMPFETQAAKRTQLLLVARTHFGLKPEDWLLIIDADERVEVIRPDWRAKLERGSSKLVALVEGESWSRMPRLLRPLPDIAYDEAHNRVVSNGTVLVDGAPKVSPLDLFGCLRLAHDRNDREYDRNVAANLYRLNRRETGER